MLKFLRNIKIRYKIIFIIVMNIIFMALIWLFIQANLNSVKGQFEKFIGTSIKRRSLLLEIRNSFGYGGFIHHFKNYILRGHDQERGEGYLKKFSLSKDRLERALKSFSELPNLSSQDKKALEDIYTVATQYSTNLKLAESMKREGYSIEEIDTAVHITDESAFTAFGIIEKNTALLQKAQIERVEEIIKLTWLYLIGILSLVIVAMATANYLLFQLSIIKPLDRLRDNMDKGSTGDLNISIDSTRKDEIGMMSQTFNDFIEHLKSMLVSVKESVHHARGMTGKLESASERSSSSLEEIRANIEYMMNKTGHLDNELGKLTALANEVNSYAASVSNNSRSQARDINNSSASIEEMTSSIQSVARTAEEKMEIVANLKEMASSGEREMTETIEIITRITESTNLIMGMLDVINNIASQTNLLAMNAAIEAAHAGDAGKGFAVVADEIRKLSEDTTNHSREISNSLKEIIDYIHVSEKAAGKTGDHLKNIVQGVNDVSLGMLEVKNSMGELSEGSGQILSALSSLIDSSSEVKTSSQVMTDKMQAINDSFNNVSMISRDNKNGMEEVTKGVNEIFASVMEVSEAGRENSRNIKGLEELVNRFKTE